MTINPPNRNDSGAQVVAQALGRQLKCDRQGAGDDSVAHEIPLALRELIDKVIVPALVDAWLEESHCPRNGNTANCGKVTADEGAKSA